VRRSWRSLSDLPATRAYAPADALLRGQTRFSTFVDMLRTGLAAAVRGRVDPEQARIAALRSPDAWREVWRARSKLQDETERFALDKRQALVAGLGMLSG